MLSVVMLNVVRLNAVRLNVVRLIVVRLSVVILSVVVPYRNGFNARCYKTFYGRKLRMFIMSVFVNGRPP